MAKDHLQSTNLGTEAKEILEDEISKRKEKGSLLNKRYKLNSEAVVAYIKANGKSQIATQKAEKYELVNDIPDSEIRKADKGTPGSLPFDADKTSQYILSDEHDVEDVEIVGIETVDELDGHSFDILEALAEGSMNFSSGELHILLIAKYDAEKGDLERLWVESNVKVIDEEQIEESALTQQFQAWNGKASNIKSQS